MALGNIKKEKLHVHGGDIYNNQVKLDFSANINPFGMPESVKIAAIEGVKASIHYPEVGSKRLKQKLAEKEKVPVEHIIVGNGAAELIFGLVLARKPKKALLPVPSFYEYKQALEGVHCDIHTYHLREEDKFYLTDEILKQLDSSYDLLFLCNPNNPTGLTIPGDLLNQIIKVCKEYGITLVVDECFQDFLLKEDAYSLISKTKDNTHLIVLKAFTKMYGMAGLRLGYAITSDTVLLESLQGLIQPWNVSLPAQMAGIAATQEESFVRDTRNYISSERAFLRKELMRLGFVVFESKANYIFFQGPQGLYEHCLARGVLIRDCSNYEGLSAGYYRIAVRSHEENVQLIQVLEER